VKTKKILAVPFALLPLVAFLGAACSDPCATSCGIAYDREVACNLFISPGDRQTTIDACVTIVEDKGQTEDTCTTTENQLQSMTCAQFAAQACPGIPASNQGSGCAGAGG
jgi:hypothetical protein